MGSERVEEAIGLINGGNVNFATPTPYQPGTLRLFKNGQLIRSSDDDGPTETGAATFVVGLPPIPGDTLTVRYLEA